MSLLVRWMSMVVLVLSSWLLSGATVAEATAEETEAVDAVDAAEKSSQIVELGVNIRTDFGVHAIRLDAAWVTPRFRALLTVDPMYWTDNQTSTDLLGFWRTEAFEPFAGWRLNTIPVVDGAQLQHNLVVGTALRFPELFDGRIGGQWGMEMATMLFSHGGGVDGRAIGLASGRHYVDLVNFGMFARFHYNLGGR